MKTIVLLFILFFNFSQAQTQGCTDVLAKNYNPIAIENDGSCVYKNKKIKPQITQKLSDSIPETSGLIAFDNLFWTHNDDHDTRLYGLNSDGKIQKKINLNGVKNIDWEEISQDSLYIYVGDLGNNYRGNRTDLYILRIEKKSFLANAPVIDTIQFKYENQTDFSPQKSNTTNFDCEAFVVIQDSIYLFTKEWTSCKTSVYRLPKTPGKHLAQFKESINVDGFITGATLVTTKKRVVLTGYTNKYSTFLYLLYDYKNNDFSTGNKRKIKLKLPFHQIEGISAFKDSLFYITNESLIKKPIVNNPQQMHLIDLSSFLKN
ncbi:MAG: T9SS C-terminal target domain-containing protein [Flavobacterium sp.]|nr:T9SS C-terminal target domain-containing protein [Flavobacterium sp.]